MMKDSDCIRLAYLGTKFWSKEGLTEDESKEMKELEAELKKQKENK